MSVRLIHPSPPQSLPSHLTSEHLVSNPASALKYPYRDRFKRVLDTLAVLSAVPIVAPLIVVLALVILCRGGKPFYVQTRVGRGGRHFKMWKLRTMVQDAEAVLEDYLATNPTARSEWDMAQKLRSDPRITRFGHFLRRSSLDELPQLWNVLKGDMSLVGPRPMMPEQTQLYPGEAYYLMRPGLTGLWQVYGRNAVAFVDRASFDTLYQHDLSLANDIKILLATIGVVLRGTGC